MPQTKKQKIRRKNKQYARRVKRAGRWYNGPTFRALSRVELQRRRRDY